VAPAWVDRLEREHGNLRAALARFHARGDAEAALRLAGDLAEFWAVRGHLREGRGWLERALALGGDAPAAVRAKALRGLGWLAAQSGDGAAAEAAGGQALAAYRALGDPHGTAYSLVVLGVAAMADGDLDRAERLHEEAREVARAGGDPRGRGAPSQQPRPHRRPPRRPRPGHGAVRGARTPRREAGHDHDVASGLGNLAAVAREQGDPRRAARLYLEPSPSGGSCATWRASPCPGGPPRTWPVPPARRSGRPAAGAAEALRERAGAAGPRIDQAAYERDLAVARRGLSEDAFAAAWAAGRALPPEAAVAEAGAVLAAAAAGPEPAPPAPAPGHACRRGNWRWCGWWPRAAPTRNRRRAVHPPPHGHHPRPQRPQQARPRLPHRRRRLGHPQRPGLTASRSFRSPPVSSRAARYALMRRAQLPRARPEYASRSMPGAAAAGRMGPCPGESGDGGGQGVAEGDRR
jgi:tetratricopeptide (TPR) repeat protein